MDQLTAIDKVEALFRESWPNKSNYFLNSDFGTVATSIDTLAVVKKRNESNLKANTETAKIKNLKNMRKYGKSFLKTLKYLRIEIEPGINEFNEIFLDDTDVPNYVPDDVLEHYRNSLNDISTASALIDRLINRFTEKPAKHQNPARFIADSVKELWARKIRQLESGGIQNHRLRVPRSAGRDDPLCAFVCGALKLANIHYEIDTVSDALRRRQARRGRPATNTRT